MILKLISIGVVALLVYGIFQRKRPAVHIPVMLAAFVIDLTMVLYIELSRGATDQAMGWGDLAGIMQIHIIFSTLTVVLYLVQIASGVIRYRGGSAPYHLYTGVLFMVFRIGNLVTSFLIDTSI